MEALTVDPVVEWAAPPGETGLEEPMWQLGIGGGCGGPVDAYPERRDEPNCLFYLRTGFCGYGDRCRFNHPRDRAVRMGLTAGGEIEFPERAGEPTCQYYMRTGMCKYGASCKYHHPKHGVGSSSHVALNFYGYPLRPGEKECLYYIKTGQCKFGVTCKFHHPQPEGAHFPAPTPGPLAAPPAVPSPAAYTAVPSPSVQTSQQYGLIPGNWSVARPTMLPGSYGPGSYGPMLFPHGVVSVPGWTPYPDFTEQAPVRPMASPSTQPTVGAGPFYGITHLSPSATGYTGPFLSITSAGPLNSSQKEHTFPQRPDQPECQYYLRTGDCKYGSTCKYHHPPEWSAPSSNLVLSPMGLPLRPGAPLCPQFAQDGVCRFGPQCKFDHPIRPLNYSPSASSLTDMPVAPYPVRSTFATMASSSNLRPESLSGFNKDSLSSPLSSMNISSASVGLILSKSGADPQSSILQSGQDPTSTSLQN